MYCSLTADFVDGHDCIVLTSLSLHIRKPLIFFITNFFLLTYQATDLFAGGKEGSFGDATRRNETEVERI